jgi:hypothetical protein
MVSIRRASRNKASAGRDRILAVSMDICSANIQALLSIVVPWPSLSFVVAPQQSFDAAAAADDDTAVLPSCPAWALRMSAATVADTSLRVVVVFVRFWSDMDAHDKCRAAAVMFAAVPLEPELNFVAAAAADDDDDADADAVVPSCPAWALRIAAAAFVADTSLRVVVVVLLLLLFVWLWSDMDAHNGKCRAAAVMCAAPLELETTTVLAFACGGQASWLSFWSVLLFRVADAPRLDARWSWSDPAALATATAPVPTTAAADSFAPLLLVERTEEPTIAAAVVVAATPRLFEPWSIWAVVFDSETKFVVVVAAVVVLVVVEMPCLLYVRSNQALALA